MIRVFIPTLGRVNSQITWKYLPLEVRKNTLLVVPAVEAAAHRALNRPVLICPVEGIPAKLQWIQEYALKKGYPKIVTIHDDVYIRYRASVGNPAVSTPEQITQCFIDTEEKLDNYASVGISNRLHIKDKPLTDEPVGKQVIFHGTVPAILRDLGIRYDAAKFFMEDYHVTLSLLEKGRENLIQRRYVYHESLPPGSPGGCATYRDADSQRQAAMRLKELHPGFVTLVSKRLPTGKYGRGGEESLDVEIEWKKAYEYGKMRKRPSLIAGL